MLLQNVVTGVDISNVTAKREFIALKAGVNKLDITDLVHVLIDLNNFKRKVDGLDG